mgnify:CR=1 FL=1
MLSFNFLWKIINSSAWTSWESECEPSAYILTVPDNMVGSLNIFTFKNEIFLGQDSQSVPICNNEFVRTMHARIYLWKEEYWLEDLGTRNRTYVNGELVITPQRLGQAAIITMGNAVVVFHKPLNPSVGEG